MEYTLRAKASNTFMRTTDYCTLKDLFSTIMEADWYNGIGDHITISDGENICSICILENDSYTKGRYFLVDGDAYPLYDALESVIYRTQDW